MFSRSDNSPLRMIHYDANRGSSFAEVDVPDLADSLDDEVTAQQLFQIPTGPDERLVAINDPRSLGAEMLRTLAVRLRHAKKRHGIKKLLITSTVPGEGKTMISANLSLTLALHRSRVLLIDGDLRRASLSRWFDIADDTFETNWREHGSHHLPMLRKAKGLPLWVVPAGKPVEMPGNILQSVDFTDALTAIEPEFDWMVFDSTPLVPFGDASILAALADAVVLVTRKGVTPKEELRESVKLLDSSKIIATILNCTNVTAHKYYLNYYAHVRGVLPPASVGSKPIPS
jgi:capsular exopolysaccharide synthesis family protein